MTFNLTGIAKWSWLVCTLAVVGRDVERPAIPDEVVGPG